MINEKRISESLKEYIGKSGIISLDVGTIQDNSKTWQVVESYCDPTVAWLHSLISDVFVEGLKRNQAKEPIYYLYDSWQASSDENEVVYYSFSYDGCVNSHNEVWQDEKGTTFGEYILCDKEENGELLSGVDLPIEEINYKLNEIISSFKVQECNEPLDLFYHYQSLFSKLVLTSFNLILEREKQQPIKYVTIVLFRKYYDGKWHLSYNAAIFSNNLSYLASPTINLLFDYLSRGNYIKEISELKQNVRRESIKSAKAAIMSRNMSHNIGSHVMSYLKQHLCSVEGMLNDKVLSELIGVSDITILEAKSVINKELKKNVDETALPFLVGLGHFISYLQERQDFIATISTDYIPYYSSVNFKDIIYDELNPDKRSERHSEWTSSMKMDNILLGNIARSEGLGRPTRPTIGKDESGKNTTLSDIVLKFRNFNGNPVEGNNVYDADRNGLDLMKISLDEMRKYEISLPGGIVGRQAVFSIVENIIRNAAKHGNWREKGELSLTFDIFTNKPSDQQRIPDNDNVDHCLTLKQVLSNFYFTAIDRSDLYYVTITDNCEMATDDTHALKSIGKLRYALQDPYIDSIGIMKNGNKGLKEIRISAAWLRSIKDEDFCFNPCEVNVNDYDDDLSKLKYQELLENDENWLVPKPDTYVAPLVYARIAAKRDDYGVYERHLQYIICLPIPKIVAIISNYEFSDNVCRSLMNHNWKVFSFEEFEKERNKSFEFILCDGDLYSKVRPISSARVFKIEELTDREIFLDDLNNGCFDHHKIELLLYKKMSGYVEDDFINVDDEKAKVKYSVYPEILRVSVSESGDTKVFLNKKDSNNNFIESENVELKEFVKKHHFESGEYIKKGNVYITDGICCGNKVYRKHHETKEQFCKYMQSRSGSEVFVEGITGSNSTDRLIRNEEITDIWFYRHLYAMKQKVAIFDERIFAKVTGREESDFTKGNLFVANAENLKEAKEHYSRLIDSMTIQNAPNAEMLNSLVIKQYREMLCKKEIESIDYRCMAFVQKGVYVYTLIEDVKDSSKYNLVGIKMINEDIVHTPKYECLCTYLAELKYSKDSGLEIVFVDGGDYSKNKFDFLTIHQGLLDKLYTAFGIKDKPKEKVKITQAIFDTFCKSAKDEVQIEDFLPGLIIHSGRSKPGKNEMPQKLPFIQYAALEHSVMDCKFSLVELLGYARYE